MSDLLVRLSANRTARNIVRTLHLPLPMPQLLARMKGPWEAEPLKDRTVFAALNANGGLADAIKQTLSGAGAEPWFREAETSPPENARPHALIFDGTALETPESLRNLYEFFHAHVRQIAPCGRALVIARPPEETDDPLCRAARRSVEGFVRSMAKEIGRKGATAQTVYVSAGAEDRLEPVLRFLLSKGSAYISGQPVRVSARVPYTPARKYVQPLSGKVALVTGAARGIGEATARALAREGAQVIVMDRPAEFDTATRVAASIHGTALACDITDASAAQAIRDHVQQHYPGLDIVVHNAGITRDKTLGNMSADKWDMVLAVNLIALIRTNEAFLEHVRDGGRIIAMSSVGGIAGNAGQTNYGCTKAGVIGYVQGLAPRAAQRGITVNAVAPGFIETQMTAAMPMGTREVARRLCSLSQGGLPEDIAEAIAFLASPDAAGLTGEVMRVCGGNFVGA
jgi:3-oxoacyl-[acyl-carrier protein] reductase